MICTKNPHGASWLKDSLGFGKPCFSKCHVGFKSKIIPLLHDLIPTATHTLLLLFLIVTFGFAVYIIVKCIATGVTAAANWLASLASKLDAVVIVALITGCVSIVGVLISSIVAKRIEYKRSRQEYLAKKREEPYGQFVDMVYKIQQNTKKGGSYTEVQMLEDLSQFSKQITLWGSSRVVNKWVKFRENGTNPELAQKNLLLLEDIMNEMRKDLGLRKTKKGNLLAFFVNDIKKAIKSMK